MEQKKATKTQITNLKKLNIKIDDLTELEAYLLLRENKIEEYYI